MTDTPIPEVLAYFFSTHLNVNGFTRDTFLRFRKGLAADPERAELFRSQFLHTILTDSITPAQYELLTGQDFDSQEELNDWLREVWKTLYGEKLDF